MVSRVDDRAGADPAGPEASGSAGNRADGHGNDAPPWASPLNALRASATELAAFALEYLSAKRDILLTRARSLLLWSAAIAVAAAIGLVAVITAVVLLLIGAAHALGELLGGRPWAGELLTGGLFLLCVASTVVFGLGWLQTQWREQMRKKYQSDARQSSSDK